MTNTPSTYPTPATPEPSTPNESRSCVTKPTPEDTPVEVPTQWDNDVVLADGGTVHIRPLRPQDAEALQALHSRQSAETIYFRFFSPIPRLSPAMLHRFTHLDYLDRFALVAVYGEDLVGVSRYDRIPAGDDTEGNPPGSSAEVAFLVDDAHQGRGLGIVLLEQLAVVARENGIGRFTAETLPENANMLGVFRAAGFNDTRKWGDGVVQVAFDIDPTDESLSRTMNRERKAAARSMANLLSPKSVAVIGASHQTRYSIGRQFLSHMLGSGFTGAIYPVHPSAHAIGGVRAYPSVDEIPDEVDLAVVAVPAGEVAQVIDDCARKRTRGVIIASTGFAALGVEGAEEQHRIVERARRSGMRVVGPASMGLTQSHPDVRLNASLSQLLGPPGNVGLLSQGGALGGIVLEGLADRQIYTSTFVSVGNKADVSGNDLLDYWEGDPATEVIVLHLEQFGNPRRFARTVRRVARSKPVVAMRTNGEAANDRTDELFRQTGVYRAETLDRLIAVTATLSTQPPPEGNKVAIIGNIGGPSLLAAEACRNAGMELASLSKDTLECLQATNGVVVAANPVSLGNQADASTLASTLTAVLADKSVHSVMVISVAPSGSRGADPAIAAAIIGAADTEPTKPLVANLIIAGAEPMLTSPGGRRIPVYRFPESAAGGLGALTAHAAFRRRPEPTTPEPKDINVEGIKELVAHVLATNPEGRELQTDERMRLLEAARIPFERAHVVNSAFEAASAADDFGRPVALKSMERTAKGRRRRLGIDVHLSLRDPEAVAYAYQRMKEVLDGDLGEVVVQPMVEPGIELTVGIEYDQSFGPLIAVGPGGPNSSRLDMVHRVLPLAEDDIEALLTSPRVEPLLRVDPSDVEAAAPDTAAMKQLVERLVAVAEAVPELTELLLDPVVVRDDGVIVVEAQARVAPATYNPALAVRQLR